MSSPLSNSCKKRTFCFPIIAHIVYYWISKKGGRRTCFFSFVCMYFATPFEKAILLRDELIITFAVF